MYQTTKNAVIALCTSLLLVILLSIPSSANAQVAFSVSPGLGLNSAFVGYQVNDRLLPFVSFQYASFGLSVSETGTDFNYDSNKVENYEYTGKLTGGILMPSIGAKYYLANQNKLKSYGSVAITKPIVVAKLENDGEIDKEFEESVKSLSLIGGELGFGVEYFFDSNFSIGGEFGLRLITGNYQETYDTEYFDPNTGDYVPSKTVISVNGRVTPTYTKFCLNFYFNRDKG